MVLVLILVSECLLLVYRNAIDLGVLILFPVTLLSWPIMSRCFQSLFKHALSCFFIL